MRTIMFPKALAGDHAVDPGRTWNWHNTCMFIESRPLP